MKLNWRRNICWSWNGGRYSIWRSWSVTFRGRCTIWWNFGDGGSRQCCVSRFSTQRRPGCPKGTSSANGRVADVMFGSWCALRWTFYLLPLSNLNIVVTLPFASYRLLVTCAFASHIDCCVLCIGCFVCYHYQTNVVVALAFASHRLLRPLYWTFPALPLSNKSNMNAIVTSGFASDTFLRGPYCRATTIKPECLVTSSFACHGVPRQMEWTCHVLPLSNLNVAFCIS